MKTLGLTGSIASGKSTVAAMFAFHGARIFDADKAVHHLLANDTETQKAVLAAFPALGDTLPIDRKALGRLVFEDRNKLLILEHILHPRVHLMERNFVRKCRTHGVRLVVCDIPLLFETGAEIRFDATVTVTTPPMLQKARYMARPGATEERLAETLARQMPVHQKHKRTDFIIHTGLGMAYSMREVITILKKLREGSSPTQP